MSEQYFARKEAKDVVNSCESFIGNWFGTIGNTVNGIAAVWSRNLRYYYSPFVSGTGGDSGLEFVGNQGELVKMMVPQARSLVQQFISIVTKQKLAFECEALSADAMTMADTRVADSIVSQDVRQEDLDVKGVQVCEHAMNIGTAYIATRWDMMKGKVRAVDQDGRTMMTGAVDYKILLQTDVIFDYTKNNFYDNSWVLIRFPVNKYDLIATHPELEQEILLLPSVNRYIDTNIFQSIRFDDDYVYQYEFYHKTTPSMPDGRLIVFGDSKTILFDAENPYKCDEGAYIPVDQLKPEPIIGTSWGYPKFCDILPLQEMLDICFSSIATNNSTNGVQSILNPIGNDISVNNIGPMRFISYRPLGPNGGGKPEPLQLTQSSPETFKFIDMTRAYMMEIMNINGALRGSPPPGVTAGNALATLTTNAIEFTQNFSKAYISFMEKCLQKGIYARRNFCDFEDIVSMTGPNGATVAKKFIGTDLKNIKRVVAQVTNPLMATAAGKLEVASQLLQSGMVSTPKKYFRILDGAPIRELYGDDEDQSEFIQQENDDMRDGKDVFVLYVDDHPAHIQCHSALLNDTEIRRNDPNAKRILAHIEEHFNVMDQTDPRRQQVIHTGKFVPPSPQGGPSVPGVNPAMAAPLPPTNTPPAEPAKSLVGGPQ